MRAIGSRIKSSGYYSWVVAVQYFERNLSSDILNLQMDHSLQGRRKGRAYPGKVVGCVLLAGNQLLGVEQLAVGSSAHLINDSGLQHKHCLNI
jgi:hypothetical protein